MQDQKDQEDLPRDAYARAAGFSSRRYPIVCHNLEFACLMRSSFRTPTLGKSAAFIQERSSLIAAYALGRAGSCKMLQVLGQSGSGSPASTAASSSAMSRVVV